MTIALNCVCFAMQFAGLLRGDLGHIRRQWLEAQMTQPFVRQEKNKSREMRQLGKTLNNLSSTLCNFASFFFVCFWIWNLNLVQKSIAYSHCSCSCGTCWSILLPKQCFLGFITATLPLCGENSIALVILFHSWVSYSLALHFFCAHTTLQELNSSFSFKIKHSMISIMTCQKFAFPLWISSTKQMWKIVNTSHQL